MSDRRAGELERLKGEMRVKQDELTSQAAQAKQDKEYLETKLASMERQKENVEKQLQNALQDKSKGTLQNAIDVEKSNHLEIKRGLEREIEALQSTIKTLRQELETYKKKLSEQVEKSEKMQSDMNDMDDDLVVSQSQIEQITHQRDSLQSQLQGLKTTYESHENTVQALRDINRRETEARLEAQQELEKMGSKSEELVKELSQFKEQKRQLELNLETLQEKYDRASQRLAHTTDVYNETKSKLEEAELERDSISITPHKGRGTQGSATPGIRSMSSGHGGIASTPGIRNGSLQGAGTPARSSNSPWGVPNASSQEMNEYKEKCIDLSNEVKALKRQQQVYQYDVKYYKDTAARLRHKLKHIDHEKQHIASKVHNRSSEHQHAKDLRGLVAQMRYLKDKLTRESAYRWDLGFMKQFFLLKISSYQACNRADLRLLQDIGIYPDYNRLRRLKQSPRDKFRAGALAVLATVRLRTRHEEFKQQIAKRAELEYLRKSKS